RKDFASSNPKAGGGRNSHGVGGDENFLVSRILKLVAT
ncbi:hypothetical protein Leryth_025688, partial [Lithospermum erythrorhizon]